MDTFNAIGCIALERIVLPQTVTTLDDFCFDGCSAIKEIRVSDEDAISVRNRLKRHITKPL